jgi:ABC-type polysaccharide/polyol phosphate export permease
MVHHLTAIWKFRHFLFALVRLDLRLRYKRSVLGVGWSLLNPIAMTIVFTIVFSSLLGDGSAKDYAPFLLAGLTVWNFFRESAVTGSKALVANESYIRQSPLPYALYPLRTVLSQAIHTLIGLAVVLVLIVFLKESPAPLMVVWAVIPALVLALLCAWAVATLTAFANVYFQDTEHLLEVGAQIMFFLTPIVYRPEHLENKVGRWVVALNPVNLFLELIRTPLLTGEPAPLEWYGHAALLTVVLIGLAAGTIAWLQKKLIFHL